MGKVNIFGQMENNIKEIGKIIQCTDMVYIHGMMEGDIKDNILWIKKKASANTNGLTAKYIKECG